MKRIHAKIRFSTAGWIVTIRGEDYALRGMDQLEAQEFADNINDECVSLSIDEVVKKYPAGALMNKG